MTRPVLHPGIFVIVLMLAGAGLAQDWQHRELEQGTKPALALTLDGQPMIIYMLERAQGWVKIAQLEGDSWQITVVDSGYFYGPPDIAIGADGVPHATYHDHQDLNVDVSKGDAVYVTLVEGELVSRTARDAGHDGWDGRITVDADGRPHMSAIDPREFGGAGIEYYVLRNNGSWDVEAIGSGPQTYKYATSVAVTPDGSPLISYHDSSDKSLKLATRGADGWQIETVDDAEDTGLFSYLTVDDQGGVHISYFERRDRSAGVVRYAYRSTPDADWLLTTVDQLTAVFTGFTGARNITSLTLDSQGRPWIAFSDESVIRVAHKVAAGWEIETVLESDPASAPLGQIVSLKLDADDRPHLAYTFITDKNELDGVVWYATRP